MFARTFIFSQFFVLQAGTRTFKINEADNQKVLRLTVVQGRLSVVNCRTFLSCRCYYIYKLESQKTLGTRLRIRFSRGCLPFTTNSGEFRLGRKSMVNIFGVRPAGKFPRANGNSGRFPFSQNVRKFRLGRKWKTFRRFVPLGNSRN